MSGQLENRDFTSFDLYIIKDNLDREMFSCFFASFKSCCESQGYEYVGHLTEGKYTIIGTIKFVIDNISIILLILVLIIGIIGIYYIMYKISENSSDY